jgi:DNA polymerase-3 subunit epsilon
MRFSSAWPTVFVLLDCETTGGKASRDRITELALKRFEQGVCVAQFQSLINPETYIPEMITRITGISQTMVADAPRFEALAPQLLPLLEGAVFIAHNARFDYGFLKQAFARAGHSWSAKTLCSVKLSRSLYPQHKRHGLDALIARFGWPVQSRHRAMADVEFIERLLVQIEQDHAPEDIAACVNGLLRRPSLPSHLDESAIDALPNTPGVYRFYTETGRLLYVGKSVNLRARVMSHFTQDHANAKDLEMSGLIHHLDFTPTPSDFGAQLLENTQIKTLSPEFNRRQKKVGRLYQLALNTDAQGYLSVKIVSADVNDAQTLLARFGLFRSQKQAQITLDELVKKHQLCQRLAGLESKKAGPCFAYQLKQCKGACCGQESTALYNLRTQLALVAYQHKVWPYAGAILVREGAGEGEIFHLLHQWVYLGAYLSLDEAREAMQARHIEPPPFDLDTYYILVRFLLNPALMMREGLSVVAV